MFLTHVLYCTVTETRTIGLLELPTRSLRGLLEELECALADWNAVLVGELSLRESLFDEREVCFEWFDQKINCTDSTMSIVQYSSVVHK